MHVVKVILTFLFLGSVLTLQAQVNSFSYTANQEKLESVFQQLENEYQLLFSFQPADVENIKVSGIFKADNLQDFLVLLLAKTNLEYQIIDGRYVLLKQKVLSETPKTKLCGSVFDGESNEKLFFASVYLKNSSQGTNTTEEGIFELETFINPGDILVISFMGYEEREFPAELFAKGDCPEVKLNIRYFGEPVIVTEYLTGGISQKENNTYARIDPNQMSVLPGQSDPDVLNTIKFLPGVTSPDGSASNISIRGGTSDQNLILWEGIPVYHSGHYFGMISAFNPYIMNTVDVYRGGFGADYGGRISGLVDMKSDDDFGTLPKFNAGVNLINGYVNGKVNLLNDKANFVFSLRHSYAGLWRSPAFENIAQRIVQGEVLDIVKPGNLPKGISIQDDFKFLDANIKANFKVTDKDHLSIAWLQATNDFSSEVKDDNVNRSQFDSLVLSNQGLRIEWDHKWTNSFQSSIAAFSSNYNYDYDFEVRQRNQQDSESNGLKSSSIAEQQIHQANEVELKSGKKVKFGYQYTFYDTEFSVEKFNQQRRQQDVSQSAASGLHNLYATFESAEKTKLGYSIGLRYNYFVSESKSFLEPRIRAWYRFNDQLSINAHYGQYNQFIGQLVQIKGDNSSIETPIWALLGSGEVEEVLQSTQFQLSTLWINKNWMVDLQVYRKNINGLTSLSTGFDDMILGDFKAGQAEINGLDLLVKTRINNYTTWLSYSYSQVEYKFENFFDASFPSDFEQPHVLQWANLFKLNRWTFSLGWKLSSGTPFSERENFLIQTNTSSNGPSETIVPIVNSYNSARLPMQHQMDASLLYTLPSTNSRKFITRFGFSILNIYNQRNIYQRKFFISNRQGQAASLIYLDRSDLGITPNIVLRVSWK